MALRLTHAGRASVVLEQEGSSVRSVSAVLPAFNENAVIAQVVRRTYDVLSAASLDEFEIVVVNDGSTDGTDQTLTRLRTDLWPHLHVVTHPENRGYGAALRSGFAAARCRHVWLMDSDGQFDPGDLALLLPLGDDDTVVAGYRAHRSDGVGRRLSARAFFLVVGATVGHTVRDVDCAYKLFPRVLTHDLTMTGAMISTELLLSAKRRGMRIEQVGVPHYPRSVGTATGSNPRVVLRAFRELWTLSRRERAIARGSAIVPHHAENAEP